MKKLVLSGLLLISLIIPIQAEETALSLFDFSGGLITNYSKERIPVNSTPDCLNVRFSKDIGLVMREGSQDFLNSPLAQGQSVRKMFEYIQSDGDKYLIFNSSWSCYNALSNGVLASITGNLDSTYTDSYTTAMNSLYRDNGYNNPGKWDGTTYTELTVANSTSVPKGRFILWYNNVLLKAGITGDRSRFYWSVTLSPDDFGSSGYGWKYVGKDDGDNITGMMKAGDSCLFTKEHSTWQLIGKNVSSWLLTCISPVIGCLYADTMDIYQGMPIWLSDKGVVVYTGSQFNLISEPIDNEIKALRQLNTNQTVTTQTTAADWGAGSGTNIDTTTYSGSAAMSSIYTPFDYSMYNGSWLQYGSYLSTGRGRQKYIPLYNVNIATISLCFATGSSAALQSVNVSLHDSNFNIIKSSITYFSGAYSGILTRYFNFDNQKLYAGSTYYIQISSVSVSPGTTSVEFTIQQTVDSCGNVQRDTYPVTSNWFAAGDYFRTRFDMYPTSSSYTTQSLNAGTSWGSWGNFQADETKPTGSTINYYAITATSTYNLGTNTAFALTNNAPVPSAVGPYIKIISSFTRTDATVVPMVNQIDIQSYGTNNFTPVGKVFNDEYWLFVSTDNSTQYNNVAYVYDRYGRWTKYNGIYAQSACAFMGNFYTGNSNSDGMIYRQQMTDLFTDDGNSYLAYYTTPPLDAGNPSAQKIWNKIYTHAENSGGSMGLDYRVDGYDIDYTTNTIDLSGSGLIVHNTPIPNQLKSYYLQLKLKSIDGKFNIRGLNLIYDPQPIQ